MAVFTWALRTSYNVLTELEFHDKPMKLGNDENIYEPGRGLSQTHWWQKQDFGLVLLVLDPNSEYYWIRAKFFCYLWAFCKNVRSLSRMRARYSS
jgi:hypothetical protein